VAPPGFCNRGEVRYGSIGGLEYEVSQKLTHLLQCTHTLHNFWTSTHRGEASPPGGTTALGWREWIGTFQKQLASTCGPTCLRHGINSRLRCRVFTVKCCDHTEPLWQCVTLRYSGLAAVIDRTTHAWLLITWLFSSSLLTLWCGCVGMCCVDLFCGIEFYFCRLIYILLLKKSGCVVFLECSAPSCDSACHITTSPSHCHRQHTQKILWSPNI